MGRLSHIIDSFPSVEEITPQNTARIPGRYSCGCQIGDGWACPKLSCPGKRAWHRAQSELHSEAYDATLPW